MESKRIFSILIGFLTVVATIGLAYAQVYIDENIDNPLGVVVGDDGSIFLDLNDVLFSSYSERKGQCLIIDSSGIGISSQNCTNATGSTNITGLDSATANATYLKLDASNAPIVLNHDKSLHITGSGTTGEDLFINEVCENCQAGIVLASNSSKDAYITFGDEDDNDTGYILYENDLDKMTFATNTNKAVYIYSDGNVEIVKNGTIQDTTKTNKAELNNLNNIFYANASNPESLNDSIAKCTRWKMCTVIIPPGEDFALDHWVQLRANLTVINYAFLYESQTFVSYNVSDWNGGAQQNHSVMFYGNAEQRGDGSMSNVNFINYGVIEPRKYPDDPSYQRIGIINNATDVYIHGGTVRNTGTNANTNAAEGWGVHNSERVTFVNYDIQGLGSGIWAECSNHVIVNNVKGYGLEAMDFNGYDSDIVISNVNFENRATTNEVIDLNGAQDVTIANVIGKHGRRVINGASFVGIRLGECDPIKGGNITATNIIGINMTQLPQGQYDDQYIEIYQDGKLNIIGGNHSTNYDYIRGIVNVDENLTLGGEQVAVLSDITAPTSITPNAESVSTYNLTLYMSANANTDDSSQYHSSTITSGTMTYEPTRYGVGFMFDAGEYINVSTNDYIDDTFVTGGTIAVFFNSTSDGVGTAYGRLVSKEPSWAILFQGNGGATDPLRFYAQCNTSTLNIWQIDDDIVHGTNYNLVVVYNQSGCSNDPSIYLNGDLKAITETPSATAGTPNDAGLDLILGTSPAKNRDYDGILDEIIMWKRELSSEEVSSLWEENEELYPDFLDDSSNNIQGDLDVNGNITIPSDNSFVIGGAPLRSAILSSTYWTLYHLSTAPFRFFTTKGNYTFTGSTPGWETVHFSNGRTGYGFVFDSKTTMKENLTLAKNLIGEEIETSPAISSGENGLEVIPSSCAEDGNMFIFSHAGTADNSLTLGCEGNLTGAGGGWTIPNDGIPEFVSLDLTAGLNQITLDSDNPLAYQVLNDGGGLGSSTVNLPSVTTVMNGRGAADTNTVADYFTNTPWSMGIAEKLLHYLDTNTYFSFPSDEHIAMSANGNEIIQIDEENVTLNGTLKTNNDCGVVDGNFFAEENAILNDGTYEWAFGNGANSDEGITQPCSGTITAVSLSCNTAGTNTNVSIQVNKADVGCSIELTGNHGYGTCNSQFSQGDYIVPYTVTAGGCNIAQVAWWVRYD